MQHQRTRLKVTAVVLVGAAATALVIWVDELRFAYRNEVLKVAMETASSMVAALSGFLVAGRFRVRHLASDALIEYGLFALSASNLLLVVLPSALRRGSVPLRIATWTPMSFQLIGAIALAVAASRYANQAFNRRWTTPAVTIGIFAPFGIAAIAVWFRLPADTTRQLPLALALHPQFGKEPGIAVVQAVGALVMGAACIGFVRRAERSNDRLSAWLAMGCGLSAIARINFALFPSLFSRWLYTGDVIRLSGYACAG